jgi:hypothetical protein
MVGRTSSWKVLETSESLVTAGKGGRPKRGLGRQRMGSGDGQIPQWFPPA